MTATAHDDVALGEWLAGLARDPRRERTRIRVEDDGIDVAHLDRDASTVARGLVALGLQPQERVAVLAPASTDALRVWFGVARAGLVEVPLNPSAGTTAIAHCLVSSRVRAVVVADALLAHLEAALALAGAEAVLEHVIVLDESGAERLPAAQHVASLSFQALCLLGAESSVDLPVVDPAATAVVLYTSGTTGPPKGVLLSHRANLNLARHTTELMQYTGADHLYSVFPLYHSNARYCSVMAGLEAGADVLLHRRFSASGFWDICRAEGITAFNYQGAMMSILHKQPARIDDADHQVRAAFGAPCPADVFELFEARFGVQLTEIYGSTETSLICEMPPSDRRIGSAGRESSIYTVAVVDEHDRPVAPGVPGEIVARPRAGGWMFDGYEGNPEATLAAWRNLWFHTGDRGVLDADGYLTFLDRMKDTVRRRGENISTWEVEQVLAEHPDVAQVAAFGVPSELSEEEIMVAVVPAPHVEGIPDVHDLWLHCTGRLTAFALPRYVRFMDALPLTPSQRVEKYRLREAGITDDTHDRENP